MKFLLSIFTAILISSFSFAQGGCMDETACNYDAAATEDDGTCCFDNCIHIAISEVIGVTDVTWDITDSDGNVVASGGIPFDVDLCLPAGCYTTNIYDNNGAELNVISVYVEDEDGVVLLDLEISVDFGMDFSIPWCIVDFCAGPDFTCDFEVNTEDLLIMLSGFGCEGEDCICDIDGDGFANTPDILIFLSNF